METILLKILEAQHEILAELRLLRHALTPAQAQAARPVEPAPVAASTPAPIAEPATAPVSTPPPPPAAPRSQPSGMLTVNELTDLGGQFLSPGQMPRGKVKSVDASDLLSEIKAKNKAKSSAFAEFDKFGKGR